MQAALRREQWRVVLLAIPVLLGAYFLVGRVGSFADRPLVVAMVLLPLCAAVVALGLPLARERRLVLGGGFLWFFAAYCLLFALAAGTHLLEPKRTIVQGLEADTPSNVLGLSRLGDWHYRVAPHAPSANDLLVITLPSFGGAATQEARLAEMQLLVIATEQKAKGIAFDYYLDGASPIDRVLCFRVQAAESLSVPVVFGYVQSEQRGALVRRRLPPEIASCVSETRLGTLAAVREADSIVRMVPTSHQGDTARRSFSYRIASLLSGAGPLPNVPFAQFVAPAVPITTLHGMPTDSTVALLRDRFVVVGSDRAGDVYRTPYGPLSGVMIHALAAHSLRTNHVIRRLDLRWIMPAVFALCYVLILLQAQGGLRPLLTGATLIAVAIIASAALAMRTQLLWIDVSYPLLAVGTLTALLASGARLQRARVRPASPHALTPAVAPERFDVFLSHNSADKPAVIALAEALRERNIKVWLDVWELVPGKPWQAALEEVIETVPSAAVIVGKDGVGPWEEPEMRACIDQCVQRRLSVIPVLLPGATDKPKLPLFLRSFTWVDLRTGLDEAAIDRLEWGITGIKPRRG